MFHNGCGDGGHRATPAGAGAGAGAGGGGGGGGGGARSPPKTTARSLCSNANHILMLSPNAALHPPKTDAAPSPQFAPPPSNRQTFAKAGTCEGGGKGGGGGVQMI